MLAEARPLGKFAYFIQRAIYICIQSNYRGATCNIAKLIT
ncbi:predicted protein [Plenodomus lingam JN3]|uniref:Predicted protein n=1 Tax=Leptosphaeria maculans (strain JN3 / isolate v23.1.3 / race Av1-4-5-6-7-8) TaxID=985895 RepID=E5ADW3_LEPMJ|nr:predicted protein [Plenodomus lingam JN3]CBY01402.1 predicted protein [Plenodomus lingam JN3]